MIRHKLYREHLSIRWSSHHWSTCPSDKTPPHFMSCLFELLGIAFPFSFRYKIWEKVYPQHRLSSSFTLYRIVLEVLLTRRVSSTHTTLHSWPAPPTSSRTTTGPGGVQTSAASSKRRYTQAIDWDHIRVSVPMNRCLQKMQQPTIVASKNAIIYFLCILKLFLTVILFFRFLHVVGVFFLRRWKLSKLCTAEVVWIPANFSTCRPILDRWFIWHERHLVYHTDNIGITFHNISSIFPECWLSLRIQIAGLGDVIQLK